MSDKQPTPKKRRWFHNLRDAYTITARTYPWIGWAMGGSAAVIIALGVLIATLSHGSYILWVLLGITTSLLVSTSLLAWLVRKAMYAQVDGTVGAVYAAISQIRRGWIISEQPIAITRDQDLVWRLVGRPGVVFISEGPSSRVHALLSTERQKAQRVVKNVPIHLIQVGHEDGQVKLADLESALRKLKNILTKTEVPAVHQRLAALTRTTAPIPKGVDPTKVRPNRRALRGR
ncbi:DUF4191 domain-containing protein [Schaalia sp. lx-100]|uniref:DUF4191 domain-containing protein n=1 Tax=Schaalia sp. lx-100 TaxID=2899081 RepID=UPI001E3FB0AE|nr:DUF4191 domain-containing protein [Schaalia sp. lx-100]MCD4556938.1 DUF4191 domain-containing protein [Schaalia sp. lx-100]